MVLYAPKYLKEFFLDPFAKSCLNDVVQVYGQS